MYQYIEKARNATCQILLNDGNYGSGFFCRIPYKKNDNLLLNVLLTCEHVLTQGIIFSDNIIKIKVYDTVKNISLKNRKKWSNKEMDYSCIEILEEDEINDFYNLDDIILKKNYTNELSINNKMNHIYVFGIMKTKRGHSSGLIKQIQNFYFIHDCNTYKGTSGGVIVNKINNCVVGIHKGELEIDDKKFKNRVLNIGVFIKDIIEDIKSSSKGNEINNSVSIKGIPENIKLPSKVDEVINPSINNMIDNKNEIKMTIGFVGDCATGAKTNLIWALVNEKPSINFKNENGYDLESTVGFHYLIKNINILDQTINIRFFDLCGQKISFNSNLSLLRNVNIIALGYDITDKESFNNIKNFWFPALKNELYKIKKYYLIGNKVDLEEKRQVLREEAEKFANENNFSFFEVSAYYYINVKELLSDFTNSCLHLN